MTNIFSFLSTLIFISIGTVGFAVLVNSLILNGLNAQFSLSTYLFYPLSGLIEEISRAFIAVFFIKKILSKDRNRVFILNVIIIVALLFTYLEKSQLFFSSIVDLTSGGLIWAALLSIISCLLHGFVHFLMFRISLISFLFKRWFALLVGCLGHALLNLIMVLNPVFQGSEVSELKNIGIKLLFILILIAINTEIFQPLHYDRRMFKRLDSP